MLDPVTYGHRGRKTKFFDYFSYHIYFNKKFWEVKDFSGMGCMEIYWVKDKKTQEGGELTAPPPIGWGVNCIGHHLIGCLGTATRRKSSPIFGIPTSAPEENKDKLAMKQWQQNKPTKRHKTLKLKYVKKCLQRFVIFNRYLFLTLFRAHLLLNRLGKYSKILFLGQSPDRVQ